MRQVGYLPELYEDARSEIYIKIKKKTYRSAALQMLYSTAFPLLKIKKIVL